jgi:hypothetical protein
METGQGFWMILGLILFGVFICVNLFFYDYKNARLWNPLNQR